MNTYQKAGVYALKFLKIHENQIEKLAKHFSIENIVQTALELYKDESNDFTLSERLSQEFFAVEELIDEELHEYIEKRKFAEDFVIINDDVPNEIYAKYERIADKVALKIISSKVYHERILAQM